MKSQPISQGCVEAFEDRSHVCFGISPFNSYFSEARIQELAEWGLREFDSIHFFVPDGPAAYTLEALGYSLDKAAWKARRQGQYTINKIHRALKNLAMSDVDAWKSVLDWKVLTENVRYLEFYWKVQNLYNKDSQFRRDCLEASHWVLEKRVDSQIEITENVLESAVRYFLAEIPLFADTAGIVGAQSSSFCYHQSIPFIEKLYRGELAIEASPAQAYVIVQPDSTCRAEGAQRAIPGPDKTESAAITTLTLDMSSS